MWCPEGYLHFFEVYSGDSFRDCAKLFIQERGKGWMQDRSKPTERFPQLEEIIREDGDLSYIVTEVVSRWVFLKFLETRLIEVSLCSPQGAAVRCDFPIGLAMPEMEKHYWEEFGPYTADTDAYVELFKRDLDLEFFGIDFATSLVKLPPFGPDSELNEFDTSTIIHPSRWFWDGLFDADKRSIWKAMAQFEGWAVCFRRDPLLESGESVYSAFLAIPDVFNFRSGVLGENPLAQSRGGRPSLRGTAAREFMMTYPLGLNEVNLTEASRKLGYDRKTLRRALIDVGVIGDATED